VTNPDEEEGREEEEEGALGSAPSFCPIIVARKEVTARMAKKKAKKTKKK